MKNLVLSLFPGAGLLDRGFERAGFVVVRGPDQILGQDIRTFTARAVTGAFEGIIGGPPCQDFSRARRRPPTGYGLKMLAEYARAVTEAQPDWFLMECVPNVPDMVIAGYVTQRFNLFASEFGVRQKRNRAFQFGSRDGVRIMIQRGSQSHRFLARAVVAKESSCSSRPKEERGGFEAWNGVRRNFATLCELQGLPRSFDLPGASRTAKIRAVGNGVPVPMAAAVAKAIRDRTITPGVSQPCICNCGRPVTGNQLMATPACRKRMERRRRVTAAESHGRGLDSDTRIADAGQPNEL